MLQHYIPSSEMRDGNKVVSQTFLKTLSYAVSALRKLSVSLPESLWALEGQLAVLLVLLGKLGEAEGSERQKCKV